MSPEKRLDLEEVRRLAAIPGSLFRNETVRGLLDEIESLQDSERELKKISEMLDRELPTTAASAEGQLTRWVQALTKRTATLRDVRSTLRHLARQIEAAAEQL